MPSSTYDYCEANLPNLREELISICKNYNVKYIDFYNMSLGIDQKKIFVDGIHFNEEGNKLLFSEFIKVLNS